MKLSKLMHIASVIFGFIGLFMWIIVLFVWPADAILFGITRNLMIVCTVLSFLTAIWLQIATIHHMMLEKHGEII